MELEDLGKLVPLGSGAKITRISRDTHTLTTHILLFKMLQVGRTYVQEYSVQ